VKEMMQQVITHAHEVGFDLDPGFVAMLIKIAGGDLDRVVFALEAVARYAKRPDVHILNMEGVILNAVKKGYGKKRVRMVSDLKTEQKEAPYSDIYLT
jgi:hypothetical protein